MMDQAITRAACAESTAAAPAAGAPRALGEFKGYVDGEPAVRWFDRKNMPQVGDKLFAAPVHAAGAEPRTWALLLTSENHGTVGPVGSTFPHAGEKHERVQVMEIVESGAAPAPGTDLGGLVRITIEGSVIPLAGPSAPIGETVDTPRVDALMAKWDDDGATRGSAFCELRDLARELERAHIDQHVASQVRAARDADPAIAHFNLLRTLRQLLDGSQPKDVPGALAVIDAALTGKRAWEYEIEPPTTFVDYVRANHSGDVVFHDPAWHARRLWNAAMRNAQAPASESLRSPQEAAGTEKGARDA